MGQIYILEAVGDNPSRIGWKYVGQTQNSAKLRKHCHFCSLKKSTHVNPKLQRYFNKYGEHSLKFSILGDYDKKDLNFWEKFFIQSFDSFNNGFNCNEGGSNWRKETGKFCSLKNIHTGEIDSQPSIIKFCEKHNLSEELVGKILNRKIIQTRGWTNIDNTDLSQKKQYELISPSGEKHILYSGFDTKKEFCIKHNIKNRKRFAAFVSGLKESAEGWTRPDSRIKPTKTYKLVSRDGIIVEFSNISQFEKKYMIKGGRIGPVCNNKQKSSYGWKLWKEIPDIVIPRKNIGKKIYKEEILNLVSPDGKLITTNCLAKLCEENNLNKRRMREMVSGLYLSSCGGWRLYKEESDLIPYINTKKAKTISLVDPNGKAICYKSITRFSKDNHISRKQLRRLMKGEIMSCKGWTLYKETNVS